VLSEEDKIESEEELIKDVMSIMNVYVAKMNGLRKYKKLSKKE
jgi:predicted site-specific integrase-resolvase